jgi:hypothetical protein
MPIRLVSIPLNGLIWAWLRATFANFTLLPFKDVSLPAGAISSLLLKKPDNLLLCVVDRADTLLARQVAWLPARFRVAIFVIRKP